MPSNVITGVHVTADDLQGGGASCSGYMLLEVLAKAAARSKTPLLIRVDFPGDPDGGFQLRARRMGRLARLFWQVGSKGESLSRK